MFIGSEKLGINYSSRERLNQILRNPSLHLQGLQRCGDGTQYCGFTVNQHAAAVLAGRNLNVFTGGRLTDAQTGLTGGDEVTGDC